MLKKSIKICVVALLLIIVTITTVYAVNEDATLSKVEDNTCKIELGEDGEVIKKLLSVDNANKEVSLQIDITNLDNKEEEIIPSEIMLVIDNSKSMQENTLSNGTKRKDAVFSAAKALATNILKDQPSSKIGIVSFSTNTDTSKEGTLEDAKLIIAPTNNISNITSAIDGITADGPRTNIDAGLQIAKNAFTNGEYAETVILLTDGVPNTAVGGIKLTYSGQVTTKTKETLKSIKDDSINIITVMTGVNSTYQPDPTGATSSEAAGKTYKDLAEEIFGTQSNPNYGKFYYVSDDNVTATITDSVYSDVTIVRENYLSDITLVDYFPIKILENYEFEVYEKENIGTVTPTVNYENNSITWTIQKLNPQETASFKYKLKLKEKYNEEIINLVMPTNEKVDVKYTDTEGNIKNVSSTVSPTIILTKEPKEEPVIVNEIKPNNIVIDNTVAPTKIPQTGETLTGIVLLISVGISVLTYISYRRNKKM